MPKAPCKSPRPTRASRGRRGAGVSPRRYSLCRCGGIRPSTTRTRRQERMRRKNEKRGLTDGRRFKEGTTIVTSDDPVDRIYDVDDRSVVNDDRRHSN